MEYKKISIPKPQKWKDSSIPIYENAVHTILSPEQQKHEEIKQKAWDLAEKCAHCGKSLMVILTGHVTLKGTYCSKECYDAECKGKEES